MSDKDFIKEYLEDFSSLVKPNDKIIERIINARDILVQAKKDRAKIIICGNGGSAAIASHVSVDLTKNANIRSVNFNESDLITCFSNDYGYERWIEKAIEFYGDEGDVFIAISSSGSSKNILRGCKVARKKSFSKVITLSGMNSDNSLRKLGDINLWVDSMAYNHIENIHQFWLLSIVDLIIGKAEYSANPNE